MSIFFAFCKCCATPDKRCGATLTNTCKKLGGSEVSEKQSKEKAGRTIGKLEKSVMITRQMKHRQEQIKDKAIHSVYAEEDTPAEYASELLKRGEEKVVYAGDDARRKAMEAYTKRKELKKVRKKSTKKNYSPIVNGWQFDKTNIASEMKKESEKTAQEIVQHTNCTVNETHNVLQTMGRQTRNQAKAIWQKRTQMELVREKTKAISTTIGKKVGMFFASSLKMAIKASQELMVSLGIGGTFIVGILIVLFMIGSAILFFGDSASTEYTPVSAEVQQYDQLIRLYASKYEMTDYVDLIKAIMMQESGGRGKDPMQASEGSFNTKYPKEPNGITDPEYSIACGIQELKSALDAAGVESPVDMDKIKLALQSYNFGNGYLSWAIEKDGGYTLANAIEFSELMAKKLGWDSYGDTEYVSHVLRYYPFTGIASGSGNSDIVEVAESQLGNVGGKTYWSWYGFNSRVEWCACFVSWCANECGYISDGTMIKFSYCQTGANWFKKNKRWQSRYYEPVAGDIIFFDWEGDGHTDHVGIVEKCENGKVYTIEGNSGNAVNKKQYMIKGCMVYGYGILEKD